MQQIKSIATFMPDFPLHRDVTIAANWGCRFCGGNLEAKNAYDSDYPPGRGQYAIKCEQCQCYTFFDLDIPLKG